MEIEVMDEVCAEMILMQKTLFLLFFVAVLKRLGGGVTEAETAAHIFTISTNHYNNIPAIGRAI
jgi:hypothetical protein